MKILHWISVILIFILIVVFSLVFARDNMPISSYYPYDGKVQVVFTLKGINPKGSIFINDIEQDSSNINSNQTATFQTYLSPGDCKIQLMEGSKIIDTVNIKIAGKSHVICEGWRNMTCMIKLAPRDGLEPPT